MAILYARLCLVARLMGELLKSYLKILLPAYTRQFLRSNFADVLHQEAR